MTKNLLRGIALALAALTLAACGTAGSGFQTTGYGTTGQLTAEQSAVSHTRNYMVDTVTGYDENGHKNPPRLLTYEESIMVAETDQYCAARASEVEGLAMEYLQTGVGFSIIGAVAQAAGALGVPGADLTSYASLGGGSFAGSGVATTRTMIRQGLTILHATCMTYQIRQSRDPRLAEITIYPVIAGRAVRPRMGNTHSESPAEREARFEREDQEAAQDEDVPFTPVPM